MRNLLRQYNLSQSLEDIWALASHLTDKTPLPPSFGNGRPHLIKDFVHPWDLAIITREIISHASPVGTLRLNTFASVGAVTNKLRDIENAASALYFQKRGRSADAAVASLYATLHRQFPWQRQRHQTTLMRYLKVFGEETVETVLLQGTGLSIRDWYLMGMAVSGHMLKEPGINAQQDFQPFGISAAKSESFFKTISIGIEDLRKDIVASQLYDENWEYSWNPLEKTPLVSLDPAFPNRLHCPIPELVLRRISRGLFYDLLNVKGFSSPFGRAFETYVGDLIRETFAGFAYELLEERPYKVGSNTKHGTDWILMDAGANLFIECKTKRVTQAAKMTFDRDVVIVELDVLATAIVQLYKNIADAQKGLTQWKPNDLPIIPLIVTLEDWYLFGPEIHNLLRELVRAKLSDNNIEAGVLESMPYHVASSSELECVAGVLARVGLDHFFDVKQRPEHNNWLLQDFARVVFPDAWSEAPRVLFKQDWVRVIPELGTDVDMVSSHTAT